MHILNIGHDREPVGDGKRLCGAGSCSSALVFLFRGEGPLAEQGNIKI